MSNACYDKRPAFARWLWRDRTQEHWAHSIAVDAVATLVLWGLILVLVYATMDWWVPKLFSYVCGRP